MRLPLPVMRVDFDEEDLAAAGVQASPVATPGASVRSATSE